MHNSKIRSSNSGWDNGKDKAFGWIWSPPSDKMTDSALAQISARTGNCWSRSAEDGKRTGNLRKIYSSLRQSLMRPTFKSYRMEKLQNCTAALRPPFRRLQEAHLLRHGRHLDRPCHCLAPQHQGDPLSCQGPCWGWPAPLAPAGTWPSWGGPCCLEPPLGHCIFVCSRVSRGRGGGGAQLLLQPTTRSPTIWVIQPAQSGNLNECGPSIKPGQKLNPIDSEFQPHPCW